jgi:hypothetical protein
MHRSKNVAAAVLLVVAALALAGCARDVDPFGPAAPAESPFTISTVSDVVTINSYVVSFLGRTFDGTNTTFAYHVRGTGVEPALSHFTVELPPCAPAGAVFEPAGSANVNTNQNSGIYGVEWHLEVEADDSQGRV